MKKKWLHNFKIDRKVEKKETEKTTNEDNEEVEVTKTVTDIVPTDFYLKKPNRKLYDDAELFYGVKMSEGIKAGLLTRNLLAKRYEDDGGAFSEAEKERYSELYTEIYNKENEYQRLQLNLENKSQEFKERVSGEIISELAELRRELVEIENSQSNIFDQTAENRAKNQTIMWWVLQLAHWKEHSHENEKQFFQGKEYDERLNSYDEYEDSDDEFLNEAIRKLAFFVSFWYMGRATTSEDFTAVEELYNEQNPTDEEVVEEVEESAEEAEEIAEEIVKETAGKEVKTKKKPAKSRTDAVRNKKRKSEAKKTTEKVAEKKEEAGKEDLAPSPVAEASKTIVDQTTETEEEKKEDS